MLTEGIYESLITQSISRKLSEIDQNNFWYEKRYLDNQEAAQFLAQHTKSILQFVLKEIQDKNKDVSTQIQLCNELIQFLDSKLALENISDLKIHEDKILTGLFSTIGKTDKQLEDEVKRKLPLSGLTVSTLFTGSNADISMDNEIEKDMLSADRIYLLVSFIRWSGLVLFEKILREVSQREKIEIRVLTTTYMGATEARALEFLSQLPNTKIRISYNTSHERLHAKSYIFERNNGFDTAYIGSSNISKSALTKGLEWNLRVTKQENPHIIEKAKATFEHYWTSADFEDFEIGGLERFKKALSYEKKKNSFRRRALLHSNQSFPLSEGSIRKTPY